MLPEITKEYYNNIHNNYITKNIILISTTYNVHSSLIQRGTLALHC